MATIRFWTVFFVLSCTWFSFFVHAQPSKNVPLDTLWQRVDEYESDGLPKSALAVIDTIYRTAKLQGLYPDAIKALMHRIKYTKQLEPDPVPGLIQYVESEINGFPSPAKNIGESMLAELYQNYYQENQWIINGRTPATNTDLKEMQEWDFTRFFSAIRKHYQASLQNPELLVSTNTSEFAPIIEKGNATKERPTLYDFLVNRTLYYFSGNDMLSQHLSDAFLLNEAEAFAPSTVFVSFPFETLNSSHPLAEALQLYQNWLKIRLASNKERHALLFADLQRFDFVKTHSTRTDKDSLYLSALNQLLIEFTEPNLHAEVTYRKAEYYNDNNSLYQHGEPQTEKYRNYLLIACRYAEETLAESTDSLLQEKCRFLINIIQRPQLSYESEAVTIPETVFPVSLTFANVKKVFIRANRLSLDQLEKNQRNYNRNEYYKSLISQSTQTYTYSLDLPAVTNFREYNTELLVNPLPKGYYLLTISNTETFNPDSGVVAFHVIQASNLAYLQKSNSNGSQQFYVANRVTGTPIQGAIANVYQINYNYRKSGNSKEFSEKLQSDKDGMVVVKASDKKNSGSLVLQFISENDTLQTNNFYTYQPNIEQPQKRIDWFTDRAIYRPGQIVYFKGLVTEKAGKTAPKKVEKLSVNISFRDANWQEISKQSFTTNSFGTFNGSLVIPQGILNGQFTIQSNFGRKTIQVEEYKRPTFEATMDTLKGQYKLEQPVEVTGKALAYNGMAVSGAKATWRVVRAPHYRGWWMPQLNEQQVAFGESVTDDNGVFHFQFKAVSGEVFPSKGSSFTFRMEVSVTETSGETQTVTDYLTIGGTSLQINLASDDKLDIRNPSKWNITVTNNSGQEAQAKVQILVSKLQLSALPLLERKWQTPDTTLFSESAYQKAFPGFHYNSSDYYKKLPPQGNARVNEELEVKGAVSYLPKGVEHWEPGIYKLELKAQDAFGEWVSQTNYVTVFDGSSKKVPFAQIGWKVNAKQKLEPGSVGKLKIGTSENVWVLYDVEFDGTILHSEQVALKNGIKEFTWPVTEDLRGGFALHATYILQGRVFEQTQVIEVPFTNKELKISYQTFRNKMHPGAKEEWTLKLEGPKGEKVAAEMVASMYDASLDQLAPNPWNLNLYPGYYYNNLWEQPDFGADQAVSLNFQERDAYSNSFKTYDQLNWFGAFSYSGMGMTGYRRKNYSNKAEQIPMTAQYMVEYDQADLKIADSEMDIEEATVFGNSEMHLKNKNPETKKIELRTNFNETAFFYPNLYADSSGVVTIKFTLPESLTRWKFQALAHTKNLEYGITQNEVVAQKELMVHVQAPRFVTQGDQLMLPCKIENLTDSVQSGKVTLNLSNPLSDANYSSLVNGPTTLEFTCQPKGSQTVFWPIAIPDTITALQYSVVAESERFSDGEQKWIPVLSNKILVTESKPLWINGTGTKTFELDGLVNSASSKTLQNHSLTLEFTSNPSWYAVMALPYLMEPETGCSEQLFASLYANQLAAYVVAKNPLIAKLFAEWKRMGTEWPFLSGLEQNPELKQTLLRETPWVVDALKETEQKQRIALLFDANQMENRMRESIGKLKAMQYNSGAWPWFSGMMESRYVTQYLVSEFGKLKHVGALGTHEAEVMEMVTNAIRFLDAKMVEDYKQMVADKGNPFISSYMAQYLYMRSFYPNMEMEAETKTAYNYFVQIGKSQWTKTDKFSQGMLALAFYRTNEKQTALKITASLKEHALQSEEMGMFWKENVAGYNWYQAPVEFQSLMVAVFHEIEPNVTVENELKKWLLKNKQTHAWKTTKATADAVYAFLNSGSNWIGSQPEIELSVGKTIITSTEYAQHSEPGSGYFKQTWTAIDIKPEMGNVAIQRKGEGISWGALYWQYFQQIDQIQSAATGLKITKELFIEKTTPAGLVLEPISATHPVNVGDKIRVRMTIQTDRAMEFVQLKDQRAAAFEPVSVISGYRYQQGLGYYQVTHDASTDFFIDYLPQGNFLIEYSLFATHPGKFSSGLATLQCMYAPEFSAHSQGLKVEEKP
ncbi:MAG: alpha-2-macroglobulin family protein [Salinivirgaceae bacterium]